MSQRLNNQIENVEKKTREQKKVEKLQAEQRKKEKGGYLATVPGINPPVQIWVKKGLSKNRAIKEFKRKYKSRRW